jgi:hypothetical protein
MFTSKVGGNKDLYHYTWVYSILLLNAFDEFFAIIVTVKGDRPKSKQKQNTKKKIHMI